MTQRSHRETDPRHRDPNGNAGNVGNGSDVGNGSGIGNGSDIGRKTSFGHDRHHPTAETIHRWDRERRETPTGGLSGLMGVVGVETEAGNLPVAHQRVLVQDVETGALIYAATTDSRGHFHLSGDLERGLYRFTLASDVFGLDNVVEIDGHHRRPLLLVAHYGQPAAVSAAGTDEAGDEPLAYDELSIDGLTRR